jgi:hypothetical protein
LCNRIDKEQMEHGRELMLHAAWVGCFCLLSRTFSGRTVSHWRNLSQSFVLCTITHTTPPA